MGKKAAGALGALLLLAGADARYLLQTGRSCGPAQYTLYSIPANSASTITTVTPSLNPTPTQAVSFEVQNVGPIPLTLKQATFQLVANTAATASNVTTLMWLQPTPSQGLMPSTFPVTANSALWTGSKATRLNITAAGRTNITYNLGGVVIPSGYYVSFFIFGYGNARVVRYVANSTTELRLLPGAEAAQDGNLAVECGYSFTTVPSNTNPFSGVVNTANYTSGIPSGRLPAVLFNYSLPCPPSPPPLAPSPPAPTNPPPSPTAPPNAPPSPPPPSNPPPPTAPSPPPAPPTTPPSPPKAPAPVRSPSPVFPSPKPSPSPSPRSPPPRAPKSSKPNGKKPNGKKPNRKKPNGKSKPVGRR